MNIYIYIYIKFKLKKYLDHLSTQEKYLKRKLLQECKTVDKCYFGLEYILSSVLYLSMFAAHQ